MANSRNISGWLCAVVGITGVGLAVYLSVKSSPRMTAVDWLPQWITRWADQHGRFRNFPAFGLVALPFLLPMPSRASRIKVAISLALLIATLELIQNWIPARSPDLWDVFWAWLGLLASLMLVELVHRVRHRFKPPLSVTSATSPDVTRKNPQNR